MSGRSLASIDLLRGLFYMYRQTLSLITIQRSSNKFTFSAQGLQYMKVRQRAYYTVLNWPTLRTYS